MIPFKYNPNSFSNRMALEMVKEHQQKLKEISNRKSKYRTSKSLTKRLKILPSLNENETNDNSRMYFYYNMIYFSKIKFCY